MCARSQESKPAREQLASPSPAIEFVNFDTKIRRRLAQPTMQSAIAAQAPREDHPLSSTAMASQNTFASSSWRPLSRTPSRPTSFGDPLQQVGSAIDA